MSTKLPREAAFQDPKIRTMSSTKGSKQGSGEASSSLGTEKSLTPTKLPKAETNHPSTTTELPKRESVLAKSFRKLGSVLRLSVISKSFRSKSILALMRRKASEGWSDIVDNVIESDSGSESYDSYLDFMHGGVRGKKGRRMSRKKLWLARKRDTEAESVTEKDDDGNGSGIDKFVPWFEESN